MLIIILKIARGRVGGLQKHFEGLIKYSSAMHMLLIWAKAMNHLSFNLHCFQILK